jgi:hypothetical protein
LTDEITKRHQTTTSDLNNLRELLQASLNNQERKQSEFRVETEKEFDLIRKDFRRLIEKMSVELTENVGCKLVTEFETRLNDEIEERLVEVRREQ